MGSRKRNASGEVLGDASAPATADASPRGLPDASSPPEPPRAVRVVRPGTAIVDRREVRLYPRDVFTGYMARLLWREARDRVEACEP